MVSRKNLADFVRSRVFAGVASKSFLALWYTMNSLLRLSSPSLGLEAKSVDLLP